MFPHISFFLLKRKEQVSRPALKDYSLFLSWLSSLLLLKSNNTINRQIKSNEVTTEREQNHIKLLTLNTKKAQRTLTNTEPKKIKKGKNNDKMIRENGNQLRFSDFNKVKLLIDETNRLFLYKSRMNSTIGKVYNEEEINNKKNKVINYGVNFDAEENIKNKIFKQINHLIKNTDY